MEEKVDKKLASAWDYKPQTEEEIKLTFLYLMRERYVRFVAENSIMIRKTRRIRGQSKKEVDITESKEIRAIQTLQVANEIIIEEIDKEIKKLKKEHKCTN